MLKKNFLILGFTLIELMVVLTISSVLFIALSAAFIANINHYQKVINTTRLNQQLEAALRIMSSDIRRAGYWLNARNDIGTNTNNNPFMTNTTDISVNAANNCILFTYDYGKTGTLPAISSGSDDDRYGFQLSNNAIQTRPPGASFSCGANDWETMTDTSTISITALTFTLNTSTITTGPGTQGITQRSVDISVTGQLVSDATVTNTLTQHVRIRNDKFIP